MVEDDKGVHLEEIIYSPIIDFISYPNKCSRGEAGDLSILAFDRIEEYLNSYQFKKEFIDKNNNKSNEDLEVEKYRIKKWLKLRNVLMDPWIIKHYIPIFLNEKENYRKVLLAYRIIELAKKEIRILYNPREEIYEYLKGNIIKDILLKKEEVKKIVYYYDETHIEYLEWMKSNNYVNEVIYLEKEMLDEIFAKCNVPYLSLEYMAADGDKYFFDPSSKGSGLGGSGSLNDKQVGRLLFELTNFISGEIEYPKEAIVNKKSLKNSLFGYMKRMVSR